ncbi:MAG: CopG family transcriptional regulator [Hyphomicrobiales bacterium]|nr:CopG family transcriptional regulator [Hyphomicrobiales bacterium]
MKRRICSYVSDTSGELLDAAIKKPGVTKSAVLDAALSAYLGPKRDQSLDAALIRRLDRLTRRQGLIERDVAIATETIALFVRYFLTITPPLPQAEQEAARMVGRERFQVFVAQVGRRLGSDRRLVSEVLEAIVAENPALFASAADEEGETLDDANHGGPEAGDE